MKPTGTHVLNTPAPAGGMQGERSNLTPLAQSSGKLLMTCPMCEQTFMRYAAWAKRANVSYCSKACAWASKVVQVERPCIVCERPMLVIPSALDKCKTCSPECSSARKRARGHGPMRPGSTTAYQVAAAEIRAAGICCRCGTHTGPWVVRGIKVSAPDGPGLPVADKSNAFLVCQSCHFQEVGVVGASVGHVRRRTTTNIGSEES